MRAKLVMAQMNHRDERDDGNERVTRDRSHDRTNYVTPPEKNLKFLGNLCTSGKSNKNVSFLHPSE
jgi:hypothetical protein